MSQLIILTAAEADTIRGPTSNGFALDPVPLADGETWVLPERVLTDPAHAEAAPILETLPRREVDPEEFPSAEE